MASIPKKHRKNVFFTYTPTQEGRKVKEKRYNTRRWRSLRAVFMANNPVCVTCSRLANVCDHITPVRQGGSFWFGPFQALCTHCHAVKSGKERHTMNK